MRRNLTPDPASAARLALGAALLFDQEGAELTDAELDTLADAVGMRCDGCGAETSNPLRLCYQCQCDSHASGWFDMDEGYARVA